jgi:hypothetical protein
MLFDRDGAARSTARTRPCLIALPEGEGRALTLTARGVWLVQIPLAQIPDTAEPTTALQLPRTGPLLTLVWGAIAPMQLLCTGHSRLGRISSRSEVL